MPLGFDECARIGDGDLLEEKETSDGRLVVNNAMSVLALSRRRHPSLKGARADADGNQVSPSSS
jgi:hypothetical protein